MKRSLPLALLLSLSLATAALAAAPRSTAAAFLRSLAAPTSCSPLALSTPVADLVPPAPQERTGQCLQADCYSDWDCPCGNGFGTCGINNTCYYPPTGSGGGGGGLACPQADCSDDSQCLSNCPAGAHSFCSLSGTCVYMH